MLHGICYSKLAFEYIFYDRQYDMLSVRTCMSLYEKHYIMCHKNTAIESHYDTSQRDSW